MTDIMIESIEKAEKKDNKISSAINNKEDEKLNQKEFRYMKDKTKNCEARLKGRNLLLFNKDISALDAKNEQLVQNSLNQQMKDFDLIYLQYEKWLRKEGCYNQRQEFQKYGVWKYLVNIIFYKINMVYIFYIIFFLMNFQLLQFQEYIKKIPIQLQIVQIK